MYKRYYIIHSQSTFLVFQSTSICLKILYFPLFNSCCYASSLLVHRNESEDCQWQWQYNNQEVPFWLDSVMSNNCIDEKKPSSHSVLIEQKEFWNWDDPARIWHKPLRRLEISFSGLRSWNNLFLAESGLNLLF